jgi:hypothetical protein
MAATAAGGIFKEATLELETESDFEMFKDAMPGNIKLLAGLQSLNPDDSNLLAALTKAYAAYTFGVHETYFIKEKLNDEMEGPYRAATLRGYSRALYYGFKYLELQKITFDTLNEAAKKGELASFLKSKLDSTDDQAVETFLYTMQSWASLINLSKTNAALLTQLGLVKDLTLLGCELRPDFQFGFCDLFVGSYEVARGKGLGGSPEKAKEYFEKAMKKYPQSLITYVTYIEKFIIPMGQEDQYKVIKGRFEELSKPHANSLFIPGDPKANEQYEKKDGMLNAIAIRRFELIKSVESKLF